MTCICNDKRMQFSRNSSLALVKGFIVIGHANEVITRFFLGHEFSQMVTLFCIVLRVSYRDNSSGGGGGG